MPPKAEAGAEIWTRPFQLVTGCQWNGSASVARANVPKIVDWYKEGTMPLDEINDGFDLMKCGESIRGGVLY